MYKELQTITSIFNQDASANGFIATLQKDSEYKMGFIHAAYGTIILSCITPL